MILTKIEMSLSDPAVRAALRDAQKMHQLVAGLFQTTREDAQLLYRVRAQGINVALYLYADRPVDRSRLRQGMQLAGERDMSDWLDAMQTGRRMGFELMTMPFKKTAEEDEKNSRRRVLRTQEERMAWLARKAEQNGFFILELRESPGEKIVAAHSAEKGGRLYLDSFRYEGVLQITDAASFREAIRKGIGPGKAYGLGMLLLR